MCEDTALKQAVRHLGGQVKAATVLGRSQPTISAYLKANSAPADVCIKIELATSGKFTAEELRPDLADDFRAFRARKVLGR